MARITEVVARPIRTVGQGTIGWVITEVVDAFVWDMDDRQYGIAVIALGGLVSFAQNAWENRIGRGFLREIPPTHPLDGLYSK